MAKPTKSTKATTKKEVDIPIPIIKVRTINSQALVTEANKSLVQKLRNESSKIYQYQRETLK